MAKMIGTLGLAGHGKTALVRAITDAKADRQPEPSTELTYAFLDLPGLGRTSLVDIPGGEEFLAARLQGILGVEICVLCIAADQPLSEEIPSLLKLVEISPASHLVVALTKRDLAEEGAVHPLKLQIAALLSETRFKSTPIVEFSISDRSAILRLREAVGVAVRSEDHEPNGLWYLPIDRLFTLKGQGCVATGTLAGGPVRSGDRAYLQPGNREMRLRGVHVHGADVPNGQAGRRTALNLSGVREDELTIGQTLGAPGAVFESLCFDAKLRWLDAPKHGERVRITIGAIEATGRMFLSDHDPNLVQFRTEARVPVAKGQPVIARLQLADTLVGGGRVTAPQARRRAKPDPIERPKSKSAAPDLLAAVAAHPKGVTTDEVCRLVGKSQQALGDIFEKQLKAGKIRGFAGLWFTEAAFWEAVGSFEEALVSLHGKQPGLASIPAERVVQAAGLGWSGKPLDRILAALDETGRVIVNGSNVRTPDFRVKLGEKQRQFLTRVIEVLESQPVNTPNPHQIAKVVHAPIPAIEDILRSAIQAGEVISLDDEVYYTTRQLDAIKDRIRSSMGTRRFSIDDVRETLGTTRKYIIPLLEHFDSIRFTTRIGDLRAINPS